MICPDHKQDESRHQGEPRRCGTNDHREDRDAHKDACNPVCLSPEQRISDVPPIELADWHHVQTGNKQSDPSGHEIRIQLRMSRHLSRLIAGRLHCVHYPTHAKWRIELIGARNGSCQVQVGDSDPRDRDRNDQTGQWASDADIEHFATIRPHSIHANHGSHRPNRADDGQRNEVRKAGGYAIPQGGKKVPHLMRQQDRQHASGINQSVLPIDQDCGSKWHHAADLQRLRDEKLPRIPLSRTRKKRGQTSQNEQAERQ